MKTLLLHPVRFLCCGITSITILILTGCATVGENGENGTYDPFEPMNRAMHTFNDQLDQKVVGPVAGVYRRITPFAFRFVVRNFISNLGEPFTATNQLLQGKPGRAISDLGRFAINSTLGIGGLFDSATDFGLEKNDEDFGQTLGVWGVGPGPYLVLPFLGPTTFRDGPSRLAESWSTYHLLEVAQAGSGLLPLRALSGINRRADNDPLGRVRERALDPYIFIREAYMDRRQYLIYDGSPPVDPVDEDWTLDLSFDDLEDLEEDTTVDEKNEDATDEDGPEQNDDKEHNRNPGE